MPRTSTIGPALAILAFSTPTFAAGPLPKVPEGWKIELVAEAPAILFPTAVVQAPDGLIFVGQDPMDMPGPPTRPIDSIVAIDPKSGKRSIFADGLWSVMGLEWVDDALIVVHPPFLSSLRDLDGDGRADSRVDLATGLGPVPPGFNGINDHVASGVRLGIDGFLYVAVGDKGIPNGVGKDGASIRLRGGGVIRVRPDGTGLEIVSTGERNPLSAMLTAGDDVFTYGNDDDSKKWPNSLTHHVFGGHYGYPYQFFTRPDRCLPIVAGLIGGSGTQGVCANDESLPPRYRGNLFVCDWGLARLDRIVVEPSGGGFRQVSREPIVTKGELADFRPYGLCPATDGAAFYMTDWAFNGWLADGPKTGRLYRVGFGDFAAKKPDLTPIDAVDSPSLSTRLRAQRALSRDPTQAGALIDRLKALDSRPGRVHALWALDALGNPAADAAIRDALNDADPSIRIQAARRSGIRRDKAARTDLERLLRDPDDPVRRESAIALGRIADPSSSSPLMAALGDPDRVVSWSIRHALRSIGAWNREAIVSAILDPARGGDAIRLVDEAYSPVVVSALVEALNRCDDARARSAIINDLAGLAHREPSWSGRWFGTNPLAGRFPEKTEDWDQPAMALVAAGLARGLGDRDRDVRRLSLIALANQVGPSAVPSLRARLAQESDPELTIMLAKAVGGLIDVDSVPILSAIVADPKRPEALRAEAIDALGAIGGRSALRARFALLFDKSAPPSLVARALDGLGREPVLPVNDLAAFLDHPAAHVRASALRSLAARGKLPDFVRSSIAARLADPAPEARSAAIDAVSALRIREAVPGLLALLGDGSMKPSAMLALAEIPDRRAFDAYLIALDDRNPDHRRAAERALLAIRDQVAAQLAEKARAGRLPGVSAEAVERILTRFRPIMDWRVIGPFPRTTAQVFIGDKSIDFTRHHVGAEGRDVAWQSRKAEPVSGRVLIDDFKAGAGGRRRLRLRRQRLARPRRLRLRRGRLRPRPRRHAPDGFQRRPPRLDQRAARLQQQRLRPGLCPGLRPRPRRLEAGPQPHPRPRPPGDRPLVVRRPGLGAG